MGDSCYGDFNCKGNLDNGICVDGYCQDGMVTLTTLLFFTIWVEHTLAKLHQLGGKMWPNNSEVWFSHTIN